MRRSESEITPTLDLLDERASAFQKTVVFIRQAYPNGAVMTYDNVHIRGAEHVLLSKFVIGLGENEPKWITYQECTDETTADNIPGGLCSRVTTVDGDKFEVAWYPLLFGETDPANWEGVALLHIHSDTPRRFWLKYGNGNIAFMHFSPNQNMAGDKIDCQEGWVEKGEGYVTVRRKERRLHTVVRGEFEQTNIESIPDAAEGCGTYAISSAYGTDIYVKIAFSENHSRAAELTLCDPVKEEARVHDYYAKLLENWQLKTPDPILNEAFSHALLNVEYSWLYPYGWIESIQHWPLMWHMEHTAAEEWNGRYERVTSCLRSQMEKVFENGAVPDLCPNGATRRDWGGNNQFFLREVEHYVKMTGDLEFAREAEPFIEKALKQTFEEYDPTASGVIGWHSQIGNQEDMESTPGKGAATGIEGARMMEIMSYMKEILGKREEAKQYKARAQYCRNEWYKHVWMKDLGRPVWYEDIHGECRLETTYHGISYPIIYNAIDDADKYTALDHLRHRLSGPEGEVYQTNHFGDHAYWGVPTWGMQCGSDMQPFASAAYAVAGMKKEAVEPLAFIARRVCGEYQRGAWPETANEKRFAYFSPSAAVFSQGIIESIFGLKRDKIAGKTVITPSIPENWPEASLLLPEAKISYKTLKSGFTMRIQLQDETRKMIRVLCSPSYKITAKTSDGKQTAAATQHCGWSSAEFDLGNGKDITVTCTWEPIEIKCTAAAVVACGEAWSVDVAGDVKLVGIEDRLGVLDQVQWNGSSIAAMIRPDLLDKYEPYGWFGIINFARRTIFLRLSAKGQTLLYPYTVTVLPPVYCRAQAKKDSVELEICNQTGRDISGSWKLLYGKAYLETDGTVPAKSKSVLTFPLNGQKIVFSPGKNNAILTGPIEYKVVIEAAAEEANVVSLPLNPEQCKPLPYWREIGLHPARGCIVMDPDRFMQNLLEEHKEFDLLPNVPLVLSPDGFIPFSKIKHPVITIPLEGKKMKKLYVLCSAFIDNHDTFSKIMRVEVEGEKKSSYLRPIYHYDCHLPGDLDMGYGNHVIAGFASFINGTDKTQIPMFPINPGETDYKEAHPPEYPQKYLWSRNRAIECCNTVFNLLEFDFGDFKEMKELRIIPCEADSSGGIYALAAHVEE